MSAIMKIDQAGLPAGINNRARTDGLATGALVTLQSVGSGTTAKFQLLDVPDNDTTSESSLASVSATTWTFAPTVAAYGSYRIELIIDEGLATEERSIRTFVVRTPNLSLAIPSLNEIASPIATLLNDGTDQIEASESNEAYGPYISGSYRGWQRYLRELYLAVDAGGGGGALAGDVNGPPGTNQVDFLQGTPLVASPMPGHAIMFNGTAGGFEPVPLRDYVIVDGIGLAPFTVATFDGALVAAQMYQNYATSIVGVPFTIYYAAGGSDTISGVYYLNGPLIIAGLPDLNSAFTIPVTITASVSPSAIFCGDVTLRNISLFYTDPAFGGALLQAHPGTASTASYLTLSNASMSGAAAGSEVYGSPNNADTVVVKALDCCADTLGNIGEFSFTDNATSAAYSVYLYDGASVFAGQIFGAAPLSVDVYWEGTAYTSGLDGSNANWIVTEGAGLTFHRQASQKYETVPLCNLAFNEDTLVASPGVSVGGFYCPAGFNVTSSRAFMGITGGGDVGEMYLYCVADAATIAVFYTSNPLGDVPMFGAWTPPSVDSWIEVRIATFGINGDTLSFRGLYLAGTPATTGVYPPA